MSFWGLDWKDNVGRRAILRDYVASNGGIVTETVRYLPDDQNTACLHWYLLNGMCQDCGVLVGMTNDGQA